MTVFASQGCSIVRRCARVFAAAALPAAVASVAAIGGWKLLAPGSVSAATIAAAGLAAAGIATLSGLAVDATCERARRRARMAREARLRRLSEDVRAIACDGPGEAFSSNDDPLACLEEALGRIRERTLEARQGNEAIHRTLIAKVRQRTEELRQKNLALAFQNEKVIEADRLKSSFFASVSHELRTPLNAILALTDMLREEIAGPLTGEQRKHLAMVHASGENLLALINEVLDLSRIEAGRMDLRPEDVRVIDCLSEAAEQLRPLAEAKGLSLFVECNGAGRLVRVDSAKARQVLVNLLGNAIKFTEQGSVSVRFQLLEKENLLSVEVEDTGPGIAPEHQHEIFLEFHRVETGPVSRQKGTGLGLAVSRQMVNLMGGDIWLDSMVGRGSRFAFVVPVQAVRGECPASVPPGEEWLAAMRGGLRHALVVSADSLTGGLLARHLRQRGWDAFIAREGEVAARLLQSEAIDLLLIRAQTGNDSALEWAQSLAASAPAAVPIVVLGAGTEDEARRERPELARSIVWIDATGDIREAVADAIAAWRGRSFPEETKSRPDDDRSPAASAA